MKAFFKHLFLLIIFLALPLQAASSRILFNGGITLDERESAPDTGTKLEFFVTTGSYLSDVSVNVKDADGRDVVDTVTDGPWLILDLAPGTYTVQATRGNGDAQGGTIAVTGDGGRFSFMFPDD